MKTKSFQIVTSIAIILTITVAVFSLIGITITGLYPGIFVLFFIAMIPLGSNFYAKRITSRGNSFQRNYYTVFTIINSLTLLSD